MFRGGSERPRNAIGDVEGIIDVGLARANSERFCQDFATWEIFGWCICERLRITIDTPTHHTLQEALQWAPLEQLQSRPQMEHV